MAWNDIGTKAARLPAGHRPCSRTGAWGASRPQAEPAAVCQALAGLVLPCAAVCHDGEQLMDQGPEHRPLVPVGQFDHPIQMDTAVSSNAQFKTRASAFAIPVARFTGSASVTDPVATRRPMKSRKSALRPPGARATRADIFRGGCASAALRRSTAPQQLP